MVIVIDFHLFCCVCPFAALPAPGSECFSFLIDLIKMVTVCSSAGARLRMLQFLDRFD